MAARSRFRFYRWSLFVIASFLLVGCKSATPSPEPVPTDTPTHVSPTDTPPIVVEPSATPTTIAKANADLPLSKVGPWLVYLTDEGIVAVNADGTGRTLLSPPPLLRTAAMTLDLPNGLAPAGGRLAFRAERAEAPGLDLQLVSIPDGSLQTVTPLLSAELEDPSAAGYDLEIDKAVFWEEDALRWSPDGRYLAFVAALDGPSSDLYVFDSSEGTIRRLTTGDNQAATPVWTSDGAWIVHQEVEAFGTGAGWSVKAVWAAAVDGSAVRRLYDVPEYTGPEELLGTTDSNELIVSRFSQNEPTLHVVDIASGAITVLQAGFPTVDFVAFDPVSGAVAYVTDGLYLRAPGAPTAELLGDGVWFGLQWSPGFERFFAEGMDGVMAFSVTGESEIVSELGTMPAPSPDGTWLALSDDALNLYDGDGNLLLGVPEAAYAYVIWRPDSKGLFYLQEDALYYQALPGETPVLVETGVNAIFDFHSLALLSPGWAGAVELPAEGHWLFETEDRGLALIDMGSAQPSVTHDEMWSIGGDLIKVKGGRIYFFGGKDVGLVEILFDGGLRPTGVDITGMIHPSFACLTEDGTRLIWYRYPQDWTLGQVEVLVSDMADGSTTPLATLYAPDDWLYEFEMGVVYPNLWLLSPDERFLYYGWHVEGAGIDYVSGKLFSLSRLDLESGESETIVPLTEEIYGKIDAALSADGRTLAYLRPKGIMMWDLVVQDVASRREAVYGFPAEMVGAGRLAFSPEGGELALTVAQIDYQILFSEVFVFDLSTGQRRSIYMGFEDDEVQPMLETRAWTQDGWIVLGEGYKRTGAGTWIVRPDGGERQRVSELEFIAEVVPAGE